MAASSWPPLTVTRLEKQLDVLIEAVRDQGGRSDDDQMWLTRFLVVRACGYLEQVVHETTIAHVTARTGGTGRAFALSWLDRSRNPSTDNLLKAAGRFDGLLETELLTWLDAENGKLRGDLGLLVGRRHQIVHKLNEGLGTSRAIELAQVAKDVADWFIRRLNPNPVPGLRITN